ncbi:MAG: hypothetical protein ACOCYE_02790 [Pseudomonadota bacterium]
MVLRIGDRRTRGFRIGHDSLDLAYILGLDDDAEEGKALGAIYRDRCALQAADVVWAGSRRLMAALRRRWSVEAQLLYPPAEPPVPVAPAQREQRVIALVDGASPNWLHRLECLARFRSDLEVATYGVPALVERRRRARLERHREADPAKFLADVERALALLVPPGDVFEPRVLWAQAAGIPVIVQAQSAAAEVIQGLEHREPTGLVLEDTSEDALLDAVAYVENHPGSWPAERLMAEALRWSRPRFRRTLKSLIFDAWCAHLASAVSQAGSPDGSGDEPATRDAEVAAATPS